MIDIDSIKPGTVNVLIGPNGSGKSQMLRRLCIDFLHNGDRVLAVAPNIYDRFRWMPRKGFEFFGARQGRAAARNVIRAALERSSKEDPKILARLTHSLKHTQFDPVIGIGISDDNLPFDKHPKGMTHYIDSLIAGEQYYPEDGTVIPPVRISRQEEHEIRAVFEKWQSRCDKDGIVQVRLEEYSFAELDSVTFALLARYERTLKLLKPSLRIEYFLYRRGQRIPLLEACSGELWFITTIAFISSQIEPHSVIAIDEPDTSMHPTWQQSYVRILLELFSLYEPRIIISTHSPIIISGAEATSSNVFVHQVEDRITRPFNHANLSLEQMYDQLFGLITPKNHYLSQRAVSLLNALNSNDRDLNQVVAELEQLRTKSYDESQKAVIIKIEDMARRLASIKRRGSS